MTDERNTRIRIDVRREPGDASHEREELAAALTASPRRIPSKYFYDARGSDLFEEITRLPEYYLTRAERRLLEAHADDVVAASRASVLVELGAGAAVKTRLLLDAMDRAGLLHRYVPVDVSEAMVRAVGEELTVLYPRLEVHGIVGDFVEHLPRLPDGERRLVAFLGSTLGNFTPAEAEEFVRHIGEQMTAGDHFLLGVDLAKPRERLEAAYDDGAGVTAAFNRNILAVIDRFFDADFDPAAFRHEAVVNEAESRVEMWLVAERAQRVRIGALDLELEIAEGERILTEISRKFRRGTVEGMLDGAGLEAVRWYGDDEGLFALVLARRAQSPT